MTACAEAICRVISALKARDEDALTLRSTPHNHDAEIQLLGAILKAFRQAGVKKVRTMLARDNHLILSFFRSQGMMAAPMIPGLTDAELDYCFTLAKAVGARARDIERQFLAETVALAMLGGLTGVLAGWGFAGLVAAVSPLPARITWWSVVLVMMSR